MLASLTS